MKSHQWSHLFVEFHGNQPLAYSSTREGADLQDWEVLSSLTKLRQVTHTYKQTNQHTHTQNPTNSTHTYLFHQHFQTLLCLRRPLSQDGEDFRHRGGWICQDLTASWTHRVKEGQVKPLAVFTQGWIHTRVDHRLAERQSWGWLGLWCCLF